MSNRRFLVDTGAAYSILPHQSSGHPTGPSLAGPDGHPLACWGDKPVHLLLDGYRFQWTFLLAAVQCPIIGVDFLRAHHLLVDPFNNRLLDMSTFRFLKADADKPQQQRQLQQQQQQGGCAAALVALSTPPGTSPPSLQLPTVVSPPLVQRTTAPPPAQRSPPPDVSAAVAQLLLEFPGVVNPSKQLPAAVHDVQHHIKTVGPPLASRFRRLEGNKLQAARAEFEQMEKDGVVRRSTSPWASPLHMVPKKDGSWRPCGDFRRLNLVTEPDRYPLPKMLDFADRLSGCTVFSKIDLRKGYWQVPVHPDDISKTAVITPFGLYEFLRMAFGLRNAGASFQRMMDRVIRGLTFVYCYLDDLRVASRSAEEHINHLRILFQRLQQFGLVINLEKCVFMVSEIEFLGHHVSARGALPLSSNVEAVKTFPEPATVKDMQVFLGMVNFYRRFVPNAAHTLLPLTDCLRGGLPSNSALSWSPLMSCAFQEAKTALISATWLQHPDPAARLALHVDASASHVGAVLQQQLPGNQDWCPLGFFSKKLSPAQEKWSAFDRELWACFSGIRHFRFILEGRSFTIFTDHKPLTYALSRTTDAWTAKQCRQLSYVAEFTADIQHVPGTENVVADALSRPSASSSRPLADPPGLIAGASPASGAVDWHAVALRQATCPSVQSASSSSSLQVEALLHDGVRLLCDVSTGNVRPLIPAVDRQAVFQSLHNIAHPGTRATRRLISSRMVWRGMSSDLAAWCRSCQQCQRAKVTKQPAAAIQPIPIPQRRFSHVHVDLVGPLPASADGYIYIFTIIDRTSRWLEAIPLKEMSAATCSQVFFSHWVSRFGVPATVTSDRGTQFTSDTWQQLCKRLGCKHVTTTSYHPQANGMVERAHRQLKDALRAREAGADWPDHLAWVLLGLRAAPKESNGMSSAQLVFGQPLTLPGELTDVLESAADDFTKQLATCVPPPTCQPRSYAAVAASTTTIPTHLQGASFVYVRRGGHVPPLAPIYSGPYRVQHAGPKVFVLQVGSHLETVTVDRLKPHTGPLPVVPAVPATRGRPRKKPASY